MNPKLEIILTYLVSTFAFIATIKAITGNAPLFNISFLVVNTILWCISATIKLYKYKKIKRYIEFNSINKVKKKNGKMGIFTHLTTFFIINSIILYPS